MAIKSRIQQLIKNYCKSAQIKIVFTSFKIESVFSTKDPLPNHLRSNVVYEFACAGCNSSYIGETTRHFGQRIKEHLETDKNSHIFKHLNSNQTCKGKSGSNSFKILDSAGTKWQLKLKEGLHIHWKTPNLNKQVKHIIKTLAI